MPNTKTFDIMEQVENQTLKIDKARAVLHEVVEQFDMAGELRISEYQSEQISLLLSVVDDLLRSTAPEFEAVTKALIEKHRAESGIEEENAA